MNVTALAVYLPSDMRVGVLFQYPLADDSVITRFVADEEFIRRASAPTVSVSYLSNSPAEQEALWRDVQSSLLNGRFSNKNSWLLPAFFQNLLPEGVFRNRVAELRGCDPKDHFEMLAACGKDLPGAVYALPVELTRAELTRLVTQDNDALEMSVTSEPLDEGVSLSGVQPKVGANRIQGRYVARTKEQDTHIIAKLPVVGQPLLPEVEELSLRLARAAGVDTCEARLEPLELLHIQHGYDLGDADARTQFLAVERFDRTPQGRLHCEDLAQVLAVMPEDKYGAVAGGERTTYLDVAAVLLSFDSLGETAVHQLLRRIVVNEMLGNPDMHLKNIGVLYKDGCAPTLSPAYDIVAYAAFNKNAGHALQIVLPAHLPHAERDKDERARAKQKLSPAMVRTFCSVLNIPEKPSAAAIKDAVKQAVSTWPSLIEASSLTERQKKNLLEHFHSHEGVQSLLRRATRAHRRTDEVSA